MKIAKKFRRWTGRTGIKKLTPDSSSTVNFTYSGQRIHRFGHHPYVWAAVVPQVARNDRNRKTDAGFEFYGRFYLLELKIRPIASFGGPERVVI